MAIDSPAKGRRYKILFGWGLVAAVGAAVVRVLLADKNAGHIVLEDRLKSDGVS